MSIFNKRNALFGWVAWLATKRIVKQKAKAAVPGTVEGTRRPNRPALLAGVMAALGALVFWRKSSGGASDSAGHDHSGHDHKQ